MKGLALALAVVLVGCGGTEPAGKAAGVVTLDRAYLESLHFDCSPATVNPGAPAATCIVDAAGVVTDCLDAPSQKHVDRQITWWDADGGKVVCAPAHCSFAAEDVAPRCDPTCANGPTVFTFEYACSP